MRAILKVTHATPTRWTIAIIWTIVLTVLLLQSIEEPIIPTGVKPAPPSLMREVLFSTAHGITFGLTSLVWCWTLHRHLDLKLALLVAVGGVFVYGLLTEWGQSGTPGRSPQRIDVLANGIGVLIGAWLYMQIIRELLLHPFPNLHIR